MALVIPISSIRRILLLSSSSFTIVNDTFGGCCTDLVRRNGNKSRRNCWIIFDIIEYLVPVLLFWLLLSLIFMVVFGDRKRFIFVLVVYRCCDDSACFPFGLDGSKLTAERRRRIRLILVTAVIVVDGNACTPIIFTITILKFATIDGCGGYRTPPPPQ